jgi:acetylornithine deacetylase
MRGVAAHGSQLSSFPARCQLTGERRTIPGETATDVERELRELAGEATVRVIASRDPYEAPVEHPFVELVARVAGLASLERVPEVAVMTATEWCT